MKYKRYNSNLHKGASLKKGFLNSNGDIVINQNADLEYSPTDYLILIKSIMCGYSNVICGLRFLNANPQRVLNFYHYIANQFIIMLSNLFTNLNLSDIKTGFRVFKRPLIRKLAKNLTSISFALEPMITAANQNKRNT